MVGEQHLQFVLCAIFTAVLLSEGSQGILDNFFLFFENMHSNMLIVVGNFLCQNNVEVSLRVK